MENQRNAQRWPAFLGGRAKFNQGQSTADVLIRNMSASGAKLVIHNGGFIPDEFMLNVPQRQTEYRARARWRRHEEIGIEFQQSHTSPARF